MRYLWELSGMGEGFLSRLKPLIQKMHSTFTKCTMKSHMLSLHYNEIVHSLCQQIKNDNNQDHIPESLHYMTTVADHLSTPDASANVGATQTSNNNTFSGK